MRGVALRVLAAVFAAGWLVFPGFGLIDLSVTWSPDWAQVLEAGWGLFSTVLVAAAFLFIVIRPRNSVPALAQLSLATVALALSAVVAEEGKLLAFAALLAVQTAIVGALAGRSWVGRTGSREPSLPLLVVAAAGAVPWLAHALHLWALNRESRPDGDITLGIDHYSVQGALALSLAALPLLAALWADVRPFVPVCAAVSAFYLGLVSLAWPDSPGGPGRMWSAAAIAWALALAAAALPSAYARIGYVRAR